jgi:hypothetical protein
MFTDDDRRALYDALEGALGHDPAAILMAHLPPVGWADLATRGDLAAVKGDIAEVKGEIAELRGDMQAQLAKLIAANIASMIGVAGLVLAAVAVG